MTNLHVLFDNFEWVANNGLGGFGHRSCDHVLNTETERLELVKVKLVLADLIGNPEDAGTGESSQHR